MHKCRHILTKPCRKCTFKWRVNCDLPCITCLLHTLLYISGTVIKNCLLYQDDKKWMQLLFVYIYMCVCALIPRWSGLAPLTYFQNFSGMDTHISTHSAMLSLTLTLGHKQFRWKRDSPLVCLSLLQLKLTQHEHPAQTSFFKLDSTIEKWPETLLKET